MQNARIIKFDKDLVAINATYLTHPEMSLQAKGLLTILKCLASDTFELRNIYGYCSEYIEEIEPVIDELVKYGYVEKNEWFRAAI